MTLASVRQLRDFGYSGPAVAAGGRTKPTTILTGWDWYWKLNEGSGTAASNSGAKSGLGATLVNLSGGLPLWETDSDLGGACLNFNNGSTYNVLRSDVAYPANFRPTNTISIVAAVKARSMGGSGLYPVVVSYGDYVSGTDQNGWYNYWNYTTNNFLYALTCNGGGTSSAQSVTHATAGLSAGVAFLLGWTKNGTTSKWFVNGVQVGTTGSAVSAIGYRATEYICAGFSSDPSAWGSSIYGFEGSMGFVAGTATDESANMLSIAQAAGFA